VEKSSKKTFYITTPIYYVNDIPHIGHAYTTIITDAISRFKKLAGYDVFFLTGTDEHGQKVEKSALEKGLEPIELADRMVVRFKDLWKSLNIDYDFFIRTTQDIHEKGVQKIFQKLKDKGDIYKGVYEGYYCISDENYLPEDVPLEKEGHKICPDCGKECGLVSEECYFFRLSAYQDKLLDFYSRHPEFVRPQSRMNEVVSFVKQGLKDLSITRTTVKWAIQVPDDPDHTIYVWFDALNNYLTAIGYDWDRQLYEKFWPADVHFIGKDILRFHAIFWPAFLMAGEFPLPQTVFGHGWWLKDDSKMSKSKGNVLDPHLLLNTFGSDSLRYFLLREIPIGLDGNFSHEGFLHRVNSDLANDLGNLVQRTLTMIHNYFEGRIDDMDEEAEGDKVLRTSFDSMKEQVVDHYERFSLNRALEEIWAYLSTVNRYLAENEPWILAKDPAKKKRLGRILYQASASLRAISLLVFPVMPESAQKIWDCLGEDISIEDTQLSQFKYEDFRKGQRTRRTEPLFPRVKLEEFLKDEEIPPKQTQKEAKMDQITFDEFKKMDLRVGEILKAERVEGTDKLLNIEVNIGSETRQMVAGVADTYSPEDLTGKKLVVIVNLKPAVIRGIESQAMLLAAEVEGKAIIPFFVEDVTAGAKVR
jgi:methionyl-tRNA synthetase